MDTVAKSNPGWRPARFYEVEGAALRCTLCPHACRLAEGETGICQVRRHWQGRLETATFASAVQHLDAIERKPFYHVRPGSRVLTLAAPGCSFTCRYCQNYRLSQFGRTAHAPWQATPLIPAAVVAEAVRQQAGLALSYSEPSLAAELTLALATEAGPQGLPLLWKSNGFITLTALRELAPVLTAVNIDFKAADEHHHQALTGAPLAPVLAAIEGFLNAGVWVELSTPLIPKFNSDATSLRRLVALVRALGQDIPWHLLRFSPEPAAAGTANSAGRAGPGAAVGAGGGIAVCLRGAGRRGSGAPYGLSELWDDGGNARGLGDAGDDAGRGALWALWLCAAGALVGDRRVGFQDSRFCGGWLMAEYRFVEQLPDLIQPEDYATDPDGRRVRLRIRVTEQGVELLGDAMAPERLERLLETLGAEVIEQMLCG